MKTKRTLTNAYIILLLILAAVFVLSLLFGSSSVSVKEIIDSINSENETAKIIIKAIRLPRVCASMLAGAALALCGCLLQSVTSNELCAPNIIGINSGAGFATVLILAIAPSLWALIPFAAFTGALLSSFTVMGISFAGAKKTKGGSIVLAGIAVSALFNAGISCITFLFPDTISSYAAFSIGGFSSLTFRNITIPSVVILIFAVISQLISKNLNLLCLGDEMAQNLGVNVKTLRIIAIISASALSASAVSFAGLLGFVGLIVPNITKKLFTRDTRFCITLNMLLGAITVSISDLIARIIFRPFEIPCGIIMALLGAPFFIYLLIKRRTGHD
ncbi:MAG: iron ABC transporter permease [Clostridia bacterium]|nr:iron ABC transporter permease [Clostridia bacterium]